MRPVVAQQPEGAACVRPFAGVRFAGVSPTEKKRTKHLQTRLGWSVDVLFLKGDLFPGRRFQSHVTSDRPVSCGL